jgi:hypothetical protein
MQLNHQLKERARNRLLKAMNNSNKTFKVLEVKLIKFLVNSGLYG